MKNKQSSPRNGLPKKQRQKSSVLSDRLTRAAKYKLGVVLGISVVAGGVPKQGFSGQMQTMVNASSQTPENPLGKGNTDTTSSFYAATTSYSSTYSDALMQVHQSNTAVTYSQSTRLEGGADFVYQSNLSTKTQEDAIRANATLSLFESTNIDQIRTRFHERIGKVFKKQDNITPINFSELDEAMVEYLISKLKKIAELQPGLHPSQFFVTDDQGNFGVGIPREYAQKFAGNELLLQAKALEERFVYFPVDKKKTQKSVQGFLSPYDFFPESAKFVLIQGNIYERGDSKSAGYINRSGGKKMQLISGLPFRIIPKEWVDRFGTDFAGVEEILGEIRRIQRERFEIFFADSFLRAEKRFAEITKQKMPPRAFFLDLISRIRPDMLTQGRTSILHPIWHSKASEALKIQLTDSVEDGILALLTTYYYQITKNDSVTSLIRELDEVFEKNEFSRLEWDTELNTRAVMFLLLTQHTVPDSVSTQGVLVEGIEPVLEVRLGRKPTQDELLQASRNYKILLSLEAKRLLPENIPVFPGSLVNMSDMLTYIGEMADFHGFAYERKRNAINNTVIQTASQNSAVGSERQSRQTKQAGFVDKLYSIFSSTAGYIETKTATYCLARAVEGLRRGFNISIGRHGDSHEIISQGLSSYALKIREHLEKLGQIDRFIGFDSEFGKTRFTPPPGATGGIIFIDTRPYKKDGSRAKSKGHAAGFVVTPKGEVVVYDPYYQGRSNSHTRKLEDYLSENSGPKFWSFISRPENRVGAIFITGDPKKLLESYKVD